ncbi:MAG: 30S ribosomal protein S21 [Gemmatimonadales bacterium]
MSEIILEEGDRVEWALKTFRRKVQRSGILKDLRKRRYFVKPSLARRLKADAAKRRRKTEQRRRARAKS